MFLRLITALIILFPFAASARLENESAANQQDHQKCLELLTAGYFKYYESSSDFGHNYDKGLGKRRWIGPNPRQSPASIAQAFKQGGMWWDYSIDVAPSIEAARAKDVKLDHVFKMAYFITDFDLSQITRQTPRNEVQKDFEKLFATSRLVEFTDKYDSRGKKILNEYDVTDVDKTVFAQLADFSQIYIGNDYRGPDRFMFGGHTLPIYRGVIAFDSIFRLNVNGRIANPDVRRALKRGIQFLTEEGGKVAINSDFKKSLLLAAHTERDNGQGEKEQNSRFLEGSAIPDTIKLYEQGQAFSIDAIGSSGEIESNLIDFVTGALVSGETVYPKDPDLTRFLILCEMVILKNQRGIGYLDSQVVTKFSKQAGAEFIPIEDFEKIAYDYMARPPLKLDQKLYSIDELLPYPFADHAKWLDGLK